ncbi:MAG: cupin domain-containing protein [Bacteroidota bacterium]
MKNESIMQNNPANVAAGLAYSPEKWQSQVVAEKEKTKVILFAFSPQQELKTHTAPVEVLLVILEGEATFTLGNTVSLIKTGEVIRIPASEPHSILAISQFKMLLIK